MVAKVKFALGRIEIKVSVGLAKRRGTRKVAR